MTSDLPSPFYLFENTKSPSKAHSICFSDPTHEITATHFSEIASSFEKIQDLNKQGYFLAGYVSYEAGLFFTGMAADVVPEIPLIHFHAFKNKNKYNLELNSAENHFIHDFKRDLNFELYQEAYKIVQKHIARGDTYQVNLSLREYFKGPKNAFELYKILRSIQKVPYASFIQLKDMDILSFSPELFLKKEGKYLSSLPMKGTSEIKDKISLLDLEHDPKSLSENTMIVDLIRNDMGRIATRGSVKADKLCYLEHYETLTQMISEVKCEIPEERSILEIFKALFPCGSITGAPKRSTMEIISKIEQTPRGIYTGSIGYIEPNGDFQFNVAIRTILGNKQGQYEVGLGSGVLAESECKQEHQEIWLKSKFIKSINSSFSLFETLRLENGILHNLDLHLKRLEKSAEYFGFFFDINKLLAKLEKLKTHTDLMRCRIALNFDGEVEITLEDLAELPKNPLVSINNKTLDSTNIFLQHKTTKRELYTEEYKKASEVGFYDTLFFNEKGHLCETIRHNVFLKIDGNWYTPKLSSGLLPGIQRDITIKRVEAVERDLHLEDLKKAEKITLTNSLRGEIECQLQSS